LEERVETRKHFEYTKLGETKTWRPAKGRSGCAQNESEEDGAYQSGKIFRKGGRKGDLLAAGRCPPHKKLGVEKLNVHDLACSKSNGERITTRSGEYIFLPRGPLGERLSGGKKKHRVGTSQHVEIKVQNDFCKRKGGFR